MLGPRWPSAFECCWAFFIVWIHTQRTSSIIDQNVIRYNAHSMHSSACQPSFCAHLHTWQTLLCCETGVYLPEDLTEFLSRHLRLRGLSHVMPAQSDRTCLTPLSADKKLPQKCVALYGTGLHAVVTCECTRRAALTQVRHWVVGNLMVRLLADLGTR